MLHLELSDNFFLLNYVGFSEIMGTLARIGFFDTETKATLTSPERPTFETFMRMLLDIDGDKLSCTIIGDMDIAERILALGHCKQQETAIKTARTIM